MDVKKVVLITGAARGIGKAIAMRLANPETAIFFSHVSPNSPSAEETLALLKEKAAYAESQCWRAENSQDAEENIKKIAEKFGRLDVLVNNAGITKDNLSIRMSDDDWHDVLKTNLFSVFTCSKTAGRIMMKKRSGRIINISSVVAFSGNIGQANYSASKAGMIGLTKTLALEFAARNVTVNAVAPGFIDTDMTAKLNDTIKEQFLKQIPLKRLGKAEEVAEAVAFLASEKASYITGQTIHVNGGLYV